jgi:endonuclease YncB( thermonuclease family)
MKFVAIVILLIASLTSGQADEKRSDRQDALDDIKPVLRAVPQDVPQETPASPRAKPGHPIITIRDGKIVEMGSTKPQLVPTAPIGAAPSSKQTVQGPAEVTDGDTVVVVGVTVRLKGVDAPERDQPGGPQATDAMRVIVGEWLKCELTGEKTHGREIGYCVNAAGEDIAEAIIKRGLALACPRYSDRYFKFEQPEALRRQPRASYCVTITKPLAQAAPAMSPAPPNNCLIKGNINSKGERIYHVPGQRYYDKTQIHQSKGERWFCTEQEAVAAGWLKARV